MNPLCHESMYEIILINLNCWVGLPLTHLNYPPSNDHQNTPSQSQSHRIQSAGSQFQSQSKLNLQFSNFATRF